MSDPSPQDWLDEAALRLEDARALLDRGRSGRAVSAAYYAVHAAGKGVLLTTEVEELRSHRALVGLVGYHFVRLGQLPGDTTSVIKNLQEKRSGADYNLASYDTIEARDRLGDAETLVERFEALV